MKIHAFITARAGSKGLPRKNVLPFAGKPLIAWTIEAALAARTLDRVFVSTDGDEIAKVSEEWGAEVAWRPAELASDTALPKDALRYHHDAMSKDERPDVIVLLQPTSPLRLPADIDACVDAVVQEGWDSACTFKSADTNPHRAWRDDGGQLRPFIENSNPWAPRQALPTAIQLNGAVYAVRTDVFFADSSPSFLVGRAKAVIMSSERSVDIDTALDMRLAEVTKAHLDAEGSSE
ncbi:MAG: acylneuraminate cytidylyltransferase family protein [Alphaproteobacteria bacterium]|nr:acylneuraminate cytidylyltransferase family protein [Alphaproteobacteria bacterium]